MEQLINEFTQSVKTNYTEIDEDLSIQLWIELADELIANNLINDEDEMPFTSDYFETV